MLKGEDGVVTVVHEHHVFGVYSREEWHSIIRDAGFELVEVEVEDPYADEHAVFVARRPA